MNLPILTFLFAWVVVLLLAYFVPLWVSLRSLRSPLVEICERVKRQHRQWYPRTPDDCPLCAQLPSAHSADLLVEVSPWKALKSRRGAPKRISSAGIACQNPCCQYFVCGVESFMLYKVKAGRKLHDLYTRIRCGTC